MAVLRGSRAQGVPPWTFTLPFHGQGVKQSLKYWQALSRCLEDVEVGMLESTTKSIDDNSGFKRSFLSCNITAKGSRWLAASALSLPELQLEVSDEMKAEDKAQQEVQRREEVRVRERMGAGTSYRDEKVANRNVRDFGCEVSSRGSFATPADFPRNDCSPYSHVHVHRESLGFVHRSRIIFCRPVPNPNVTIRNLFHRCMGRRTLVSKPPRSCDSGITKRGNGSGFGLDSSDSSSFISSQFKPGSHRLSMNERSRLPGSHRVETDVSR